MQGSKQSNYLYMHPDNLNKEGLQKGDLVDVSSSTGSVRLPVWPLAELTPGVVALPHGWGHQSTKMSVAKKTGGVNVNILAADGPDNIDPVSGMALLTGISVSIKKADGPQAAHSWSGLPDDELVV